MAPHDLVELKPDAGSIAALLEGQCVAVDSQSRFRQADAMTGATAAIFVSVGIVLIVAGGIATALSLATVSSLGAWSYALAGSGAVFAGFGGVAVSWVGASVHERRNATKTLESHMHSVSQNLTLATSQVDHVLTQVQRGEARPEMGLALVGQAMLVITGQINQLQLLVGEPLDTKEWVDTRNKVRLLANDVADIATSNDAASKEQLESISARLNDLSSQIDSVAKIPVVPPTTSVGNARCPYCDSVNVVVLSDRKGDSAVAKCESCDQKFYIHRIDSNHIMSRPMPVDARLAKRPKLVAVPRSITVRCACGAELVLHESAEHAPEIRSFFCGECGRSYELEGRTGEHRMVGQLELAEGPIVGRKGRLPLTLCPTCGRRLRAMVRTREGFAAVCSWDGLVIRIAMADFTEFLAPNSAEA